MEQFNYSKVIIFLSLYNQCWKLSRPWVVHLLLLLIFAIDTSCSLSSSVHSAVSFLLGFKFLIFLSILLFYFILFLGSFESEKHKNKKLVPNMDNARYISLLQHLTTRWRRSKGLERDREGGFIWVSMVVSFIILKLHLFIS